MARETKKTNPIGVRFDKELLDEVVNSELARSPQTALNLYEKKFIELSEKEKEFEKLISDMMSKHEKEIADFNQNILECGMGIMKHEEDKMASVHPMSNEGLYIRDAVSEIPPMPVKNKGENAIDFAARKNEWKLKYNK